MAKRTRPHDGTHCNLPHKNMDWQIATHPTALYGISAQHPGSPADAGAAGDEGCGRSALYCGPPSMGCHARERCLASLEVDELFVHERVIAQVLSRGPHHARRPANMHGNTGKAAQPGCPSKGSRQVDGGFLYAAEGTGRRSSRSLGEGETL